MLRAAMEKVDNMQAQMCNISRQMEILKRIKNARGEKYFNRDKECF